MAKQIDMTRARKQALPVILAAATNYAAHADTTPGTKAKVLEALKAFERQ